MNLGGKFYVKSSYIRAARDDWVLCDVRTLTDEVDTFLCIKSCSSSANYPAVENTVDQSMRGKTGNYATEQRTKTTNFTALCNLSEYKSCSVRTVRVKDRGFFAIRLVPAGIIGNKQLLIASVDENEITTWLAFCKAHMGKKSRQSQQQLQQRDNFSTIGTLSKANSFMSLKPIGNCADFDLDEGILDNEVYEACSTDDKIPALLEETGDWAKLQLKTPECYLRLTEERLEILDALTETAVHWFPYLLIRRFGAANGILRVDAGRRCSTGDGRFFFRCSPPNGQAVDALVTQIRQLALEAKQRQKRNQTLSRSQDLPSRTSLNGSMTLPRDLRESALLNGRASAENVPEVTPRSSSIVKKPKGLPPADRSSIEHSNKINGSTNHSANGIEPDNAKTLETDDVELVKATPGRATRPRDETSETANTYDNLPPAPRKGARLPGAVNVLPLPIRARSKNGASSRERNVELPLPSKQSPSPLNTTLPVSPQEIVHSSLSNSTEFQVASSAPLAERNSPCPSNRPASTEPRQQDESQLDETDNRQEMKKDNKQKEHPPPPRIPVMEPVNGNSSSELPTQLTASKPKALPSHAQTPHVPSMTPTAVMRVPPFTAPKPTDSAKYQSKIRTSSSKDPSPQFKRENGHQVNQVNLQASPGVSAIVNRINADWTANRTSTVTPTTEQQEPVQDAKLDEVTMKDTKHYLNELDLAIKELCEANEAAVHATREAARRRHQLGWPTTKCKEENMPVSANRC